MKLFLDCDGVLADFDTYYLSVFGMGPREHEDYLNDTEGGNAFWDGIAAHPDFYYNLPLMPDAQYLYDSVRHLNPTILTGVPRGGWAELQKLRWRDKYFPDAEMITTRSAIKYEHMHPEMENILIDDWPKYKHVWEENGGVFILHTSAVESLLELERRGVI